MAARWLLPVALTALAGCVAPGVVQPAGLELPPLAWRDVVRVGDDGFEPVLRVGPDGTVYVASLQWLYVSRDGGSTFEEVYFRNVPVYASDSALSVAPDGRVYVAFDWPYLGHTAVCTSADLGRSWSCANLAVPGATDRMWILAPTEKDVYLVTSYAGMAPVFAVSRDAGATWALTSVDSRELEAGADLAWDPVAARVRQAAGSYPSSGWEVRSWTKEGRYEGATPMRIRTPEPTVAIDAAGTWWAVACASGGGACGLGAARSDDAGATWSTTPLATQRNVLLPFVAAGAPGHVALAWYESDGKDAMDPANAWRVVSAVSRDGGATWTQTVLASDLHKGAMCRAADCLGDQRFAGDFLGLGFGPDGAAHASWMRQVAPKFPPVGWVKTSSWNVVEYARTH